MADPGIRRSDLAAEWRRWLVELIRDLRTGRVTPADAEENIKIICKLSPVIEVHGKSPGSPREVDEKSTDPSAPSVGGTFKEGGSVGKALGRKQGTTPTYSKEYEEQFWAHWRWRGSKKLAFEQWKFLSPEDKTAVHEDLVTKSRGARDPNWVKENSEFVPGAQRYLKDRMWEDKWEASIQAKEAEEAKIAKLFET